MPNLFHKIIGCLLAVNVWLALGSVILALAGCCCQLACDIVKAGRK